MNRITILPDFVFPYLKEHKKKISSWVFDIRTVQEIPDHKDIQTTMNFTHAMQKPEIKVKSPLENLSILNKFFDTHKGN